MEVAFPLQSRIPHAADGLVRAAALADHRRGGSRSDGHGWRHAGCTLAPHPAEVSGELLTAGDEVPVANGLERMLAMRAYMRAKTVDGVIDEVVARKAGHTPAQIEEMYHVMAIANYEDRFVIPTAHREVTEDAYEMRGHCGFSFGDGCARASRRAICSAASSSRTTSEDGGSVMRTLKVLSALLTYPTAELVTAGPELRAVWSARAVLPKRETLGGGGADRRSRRA